MKNFDQRRRWIIEYLRARDEAALVDVLNAAFSDEYIDFSGATAQLMPYGAHKCKLLATDLSRMQMEGTLTRQRTGISGLRGQGFPTWVYTYHLAKHLKEVR
jgi:hypothetical protein